MIDRKIGAEPEVFILLVKTMQSLIYWPVDGNNPIVKVGSSTSLAIKNKVEVMGSTATEVYLNPIAIFQAGYFSGRLSTELSPN